MEVKLEICWNYKMIHVGKWPFLYEVIKDFLQFSCFNKMSMRIAKCRLFEIRILLSQIQYNTFIDSGAAKHRVWISISCQSYHRSLLYATN